MRRNAKGALKESGYVSGRMRSGPSSLISDNRVRWPKSVDGIVGSRCISRRGFPFSLGWVSSDVADAPCCRVGGECRRLPPSAWVAVTVAVKHVGCMWIHGCDDVVGLVWLAVRRRAA